MCRRPPYKKDTNIFTGDFTKNDVTSQVTRHLIIASGEQNKRVALMHSQIFFRICGIIDETMLSPQSTL